MEPATVRKILDVATVLILAAGLFVLGLVFGLSPRRPSPAPSPYVAPYIVPSPAPAPSLKCFDVVCPYCRKRFTVDPNPNSTGALKPVGLSAVQAQAEVDVATEKAVETLIAYKHLGRTDWRVGKYSGDVFYGEKFISAREAKEIAQAYLGGGKPSVKPVSDSKELAPAKPREPWYRRRFIEGPRPGLALNSCS